MRCVKHVLDVNKNSQIFVSHVTVSEADKSRFSTRGILVLGDGERNRFLLALFHYLHLCKNWQRKNNCKFFIESEQTEL